MQTFTEANTPADIVKIFPKASDLFKEKQIDFCCGGDKPLQETFQNNALDGEAVLKELNIQYDNWKEDGHQAKDWDSVPLSDIVDHIVQQYHDDLRAELPALEEFVTKINRVHGMDHPHLQELQRLYQAFKQEMEEHSLTEERAVFPLIKQYEKNPSDTLLEEIRIANGDLETEHDACGDILKEIRKITNGFEPPINACGSYRITYARLQELEENTFQHIHLENNILFKRL